MLVWRGWGISVILLFLLWLVVATAGSIAWAPFQPDKIKASLDVQWGLAGIVLVTAASVFGVSVWRRHSAPPGHDEFMYLRLEFWPYILVVLALGLGCATALGYRVFG